MTLSERLFETAIKDLKSVEILFGSGHYNLALFQLQQSVEKFVKSFGIMTKAVKPEHISKKIKHLPHKVFRSLYKKKISELSKRGKTPILVADMIPPHQRGIDPWKSKLEGFKNLHTKISKVDLKEVMKISLEEIEKFIDGAKELEMEPVLDEGKAFEIIKEDLVKTHQHFIEYFRGDEIVKQVAQYFFDNSDQITRSKVAEKKLKVIEQRKADYISYVWVNLSFLTAPHEQSTRYPSIINEDNPIAIYNKDHVLITHIPEFIEMMKKTIEKYTDIYLQKKQDNNSD